MLTSLKYSLLPLMQILHVGHVHGDGLNFWISGVAAGLLLALLIYTALRYVER